MRNLFTAAGCLLLALPAWAQFSSPISTDRPGISTSSSVTPAGALQFEAGAEYLQDDATGAYQLPTVLFRTGLTPQAELRAGMRVLRQDSLLGGDHYATRWSTSALGLGTKVQLMRQQGWKPEIAVLVNLVIPHTNLGESQQGYFGHDFLLIFTRELSPALSLTGNLGGAWAGNQAGGVFNYTACLGGKLSHRTAYFIEHYAFWAEQDKPTPGIDAGFSHLLTQNLQLDLSAGTTRVRHVPNYFLSAGISFRIDTHGWRIARKTGPAQEISKNHLSR